MSHTTFFWDSMCLQEEEEEVSSDKTIDSAQENKDEKIIFNKYYCEKKSQC